MAEVAEATREEDGDRNGDRNGNVVGAHTAVERRDGGRADRMESRIFTTRGVTRCAIESQGGKIEITELPRSAVCLVSSKGFREEFAAAPSLLRNLWLFCARAVRGLLGAGVLLHLRYAAESQPVLLPIRGGAELSQREMTPRDFSTEQRGAERRTDSGAFVSLALTLTLGCLEADPPAARSILARCWDRRICPVPLSASHRRRAVAQQSSMAMNFLKILNSASGGGGRGDAESSSSSISGGRSSRSKPARQSTPAELEAERSLHFLLSQLPTLALAEDQRRSIEQALELVRTYKSALTLDAEALRTMVALARSVQTDKHAPQSIDLSLAALEMLKILLTPMPSAENNTGDDPGASASAPSGPSSLPLLSLLVQSPAHITSLLDLLQEKHSVLRLYTMQCFTTLLLSRPEKMQSIVLGYPMGVILLVELLSDPSEVIRNEALLLLEALTSGNQAIQKIVAFNGALEKLFTIAASEGGLDDGGIIAEDAMRLVGSLLQDNSSNQALFLESGCVARCIPYLEFHEEDLADNAEHAARFEFLGLTLEIVGYVLSCIDCSVASASSPAVKQRNTSTRHALSPLIAPLIKLACTGPVPLPVRHEALSMLAIIIEGHGKNQTILESARVEIEVTVAVADATATNAAAAPPKLMYPQYAHDPVHNPFLPSSAPSLAAAAPAPSSRLIRRNALRHLLDQAVDSADPLERALCQHVIRAYFKGNANAQLQAMMSFAPSPMAMASAAAAAEAAATTTVGMEAFGSEQPAASPKPAAIPEEDLDGPALGLHLLPMIAGMRAPPAAGFAGAAPALDGANYIDRCRIVFARTLEAMMLDNADAQVMMLRVQPAAPAPAAAAASPSSSTAAPPTAPLKLLDHFITALFSSQSHTPVELALFSLLLGWSAGCTEVCETLWGPRYASSILAYTIQVSRDANVPPLVRGLACDFVAQVLELMFTPVTVPGRNGAAPSTHPFHSSILTPHVLLDVITKQISLEGFKANLASLASSPQFLRAARLAKDTKPEATKQLHAANPLSMWREAEAEWEAQRAAASKPTQDPSADSAAQDSAAKDSAALAALSDSLTFTPDFTLRFQAVYDKCDQRLLHLFTTGAAAPSIAVAGPATAAHTQHAPTQQASAHPQHQPQQNGVALGSAGAAASQGASSSASSSAAPTSASSAVSHSSLAPSSSDASLREENQRLRRELEMLRAASQGRTDATMQQFQAMQAQAEIQALRAGSATAASSSSSTSSSSAALTHLRAEYAELQSKHEDLLILLAMLDMELEELKHPKQNPAQKSLNHPADPVSSPATRATTATAAGPVAATSKEETLAERRQREHQQSLQPHPPHNAAAATTNGHGHAPSAAGASASTPPRPTVASTSHAGPSHALSTPSAAQAHPTPSLHHTPAPGSASSSAAAAAQSSQPRAAAVVPAAADVPSVPAAKPTPKVTPPSQRSVQQDLFSQLAGELNKELDLR